MAEVFSIYAKEIDDNYNKLIEIGGFELVKALKMIRQGFVNNDQKEFVTTVNNVTLRFIKEDEDYKVEVHI